METKINVEAALPRCMNSVLYSIEDNFQSQYGRFPLI